MDSCQLRGGLTDDVVRNWVKLVNINLSENDPDNDGSSGLDGEIPEFFGTFSSLNRKIARQQVRTPWSPPFWKMARWLKLHGNRLQGEIPASLSDLSSLVRLTFHNNRLQGEVPSGFCDENIPTNTRFSLKNLTADCGGDPREIECSCCKLCVAETIPALSSRSDGT
eukprot:9241913-Ditylum_brightwellii.AAC.1